MSLSFLNNSKQVNFCIVDPIQFDTLSDIKKTILKDSVTDTISASILEFLSTIAYTSIDFGGFREITSIVNNIATNILKESDLGNDTFSFYKFRINPQRMNVSRQKIINEKYTGAGWDEDTVMERMIQYTYQGTTGSLVPYNFFNSSIEPLMRNLFSKIGLGSIVDYMNVPQLTRNPKLSASYLKFLNLEQFWNYNNNDLLFIWEDNCYVGKFVDFSYDLSEREPYQITWRFSIKVYPEFKYNLFTGWIDEESFSEIQNTFNKKFKSVELYSNLDSLGLESLTEIVDEPPNVQLPQDQEDINWFSQILKLPYEKNKILFSLYQNRNMSVPLEKMTPRQIANWYKVNANIDTFEDSISFNLKKPVKELSVSETPSTQLSGDESQYEIDIKDSDEQTP